MLTQVRLESRLLLCINSGEIREMCYQVVQQVEDLTLDYGSFLEGYKINIRDWLSLRINPFARARTILDSSLIKIVVCGEFSSGKSFLISSLVNETEWDPLLDESTGLELENYFTLLPSGNIQTNSCPLEIKQNSRPTYRVEVLFDKKVDYELVGQETTDKNEVNELLWAYGTVSSKYKSIRQQRDQNRLIRGVRLYIPKMPLEAVFYDLPGIGGVNEPYRALVSDALAEADCIIYVTFARKELRDSELRLVGEIETIIRNSLSGRKVFFVLSASNQIKEEAVAEVLAVNNKLLKDNFGNQPFAKDDFILVRPGREALAKKRFVTQEIDATKRDALVKSSNMMQLRKKLLDYLQTQSGPARVSELLIQIGFILKEIEGNTLTIEQIESKDIQKAESELKEITEKIASLTNSRLSLSDRLDKLDERTIQNSAGLKPEKFAEFLNTQLDVFIQKSKVQNQPVQFEFNRKLDASWQEWLSQNNFLTELEKTLDAYTEQANSLVNANLGILLDIQLPDRTKDVTEKTGKSRFQDSANGKLPSWRENLDSASKVIALLGFGSGGTLAALAAMGISGIAAASGIPAIVGGGFFLVLSTIGGLRRADEIRKQMRTHIDEFAKLQCVSAQTQVKQIVNDLRREIESEIDKRINALRSDRKVYIDRKERGDLKSAEEQIHKLLLFRQRVDEVGQRIDAVTRDL